MNSRLVFILSFAFIAFGLFAVMQNVNARAQAKAEEQMRAQSEEQRTIKYVLWRTKTPIERGDVVNKNDLERVILPEDEANAAGVHHDIELAIEKDTRANHLIEQGSFVFPENFTSPGQPGYIDLLATEGKILYPLPISTINLINNYIRPGDLVDIVSVSSPSTNLSDSNAKISQFDGIQAKTIRRDVKVLALEQAPLSEDELKERSSSRGSISPRVSATGSAKTTVVIEIEPDFVSRLTLAQRTTHLEIYRSQNGSAIPTANMNDVLNNYHGIRELRGAESNMTNVEIN